MKKLKERFKLLSVEERFIVLLCLVISIILLLTVITESSHIYRYKQDRSDTLLVLNIVDDRINGIENEIGDLKSTIEEYIDTKEVN